MLALRRLWTTLFVVVDDHPINTSQRFSTTGMEDEQASLLLSLRETLQQQQVRLILASQSPRRREILDMMLGIRTTPSTTEQQQQQLYDVIVSPLDEEALHGTLSKSNPAQYTQTLAEHKAAALVATSFATTTIPTIVLASDTIVAHATGGVLEKPKSPQEARDMLTLLQNDVHDVHTGVALQVVLPAAEGQQRPAPQSFVDTARVQFAALGAEDIRAYVETGEPMDKAGAYGIQGMGGQFVESIQGDFFTVRHFAKKQEVWVLILILSPILSNPYPCCRSWDYRCIEQAKLWRAR